MIKPFPESPKARVGPSQPVRRASPPFLHAAGWILLAAWTGLVPAANAASSDVLRYSYDARQRLVQVAYGDGTVVDYVYDSMGNRLMMTTTLPGTPANHPPGMVSNPNPPSGASQAALSPLLRWQAAADPDPGDRVMYLIYFGTDPSPPLVSSGWATNWSPGALLGMTTYYWSVAARDSRNAQTAGPVWSFTTSNAPPAPAFVARTTNGWAPLQVSFTDRSTSSDDLIVAWEWDFDNDGTVDSTEQNPTWTYESAGSYAVRLRVTDEHGAGATLIQPAFVNVLSEGILDLQPQALTLLGTDSYRHINLAYQVVNRGTVSVPAPIEWEDGFFVSTDDVLDESDVFFASEHQNMIVAAGGVHASSNVVTLPPGVDATSYLIVQVDAGYAMPESNEANNWMAVPLNLPAPDLAPAAITVPPVLLSGREATLVWSVTNRGAASAPVPWYDSVYLSTDAEWDYLDEPLATFWFEGDTLAARASYRATNTCFIPRKTPGQYYLIFMADSADFVFETTETNNWRAVPVSIELGPQPDLLPISLAPSSLQSGSPADLIWAVTNRGVGAATGYWTDALFLSTHVLDELWEGTYLGTASHDADLAAGAVYRKTNQVQLPRLAPGSYYLTLAVDYADELFEGNETNNRYVRPITITLGAQPDLVPLGVGAPSPLLAGRAAEIVCAVTNRGPGAAVAMWMDEIYLSLDDQLDTSEDEYLGMIWHDTDLAPRTAYRQTNMIQVPQVAPGGYYLILTTDLLDQVFESNETNNLLAVPVSLELGAQPDLAIQWLTPVGTWQVGSFAEVDWGGTNQGAGSAEGYWIDYVFLSTDAQFDEQTDPMLGYAFQSTAVLPGTGYEAHASFVVPEVEPGQYYLIAMADSSKALFESDESNNEFVVPVTLEPGGSGGLRVEDIRFSGPDVIVSVQGEPGSYYFLQRSDNLEDWDTVGMPVMGTGALIEFEDPGPHTRPHRFYRALMIIFQ